MIGSSVWLLICSRHSSYLCGFIGDGNLLRAAGASSIICPMWRSISPALACRCRPMAAFIACVEFFGGIFLALGLVSRITGLVLTVNMTMAYVIGDREALLSFFSDP